VNQQPCAPTVGEIGARVTGVPTTLPELHCDRFWDPDLTLDHAATDWEIWTVEPTERVWCLLGATGTLRTNSHLATGAFENSHSNRTSLRPNTSYLLRIRHKDDSGDPATQWSQWGERRFDTYPRAVLAENTFESGADGWTTWDEQPPHWPARWAGAGGNPGGAVQFNESKGDGATSFWVAPDSFVGQLSNAYGGTIEFDLRTSDASNQYVDSDLVLSGAGVELHYAFGQLPNSSWRRYRVELNETGGWRLGSVQGPAVGRDLMLNALARPQGLRIRGEYHDGGGEANYLDNVRITGPVAVRLSARWSPDRSLVLEWPTNAPPGTLIWSESLARPRWEPVGLTPRIVNGVHSVEVNPTGTSGLFELGGAR
jgi:hypothetical protein